MNETQPHRPVDNLFIRMDKIGDLTVSLNADQLEEFGGGAKNHWLINKGLGWVLDHSQPHRNYSEFGKKFSISEFLKLVKALRWLQPKRAFTFQAPWFVGLALLLARVPERIGRRSQWHSYLFFNRGLRQKRSLADRHESQFNVDLITGAMKWPARQRPPAAPLQAIHSLSLLTSLGLNEAQYCVVHPGMMGSALNWPIENYKGLIRRLAIHMKVAVTGTSSDREWTYPLMKELGDEENVVWLNEKLSAPHLLTVLKGARFVVAPSTGVIHLAAQLGTPVIGFYSPRRTERDVRWGPLTEQKLIFTPNTEDVVEKDLDSTVMTSISVDQVFRSVKDQWL